MRKLLLSIQTCMTLFISITTNTMDTSSKIACNLKTTSFNDPAFNADGTMLIIPIQKTLSFFSTHTGRLVKTIKCDANPRTLLLFNDNTLIGIGNNTIMYDISNDTYRQIPFSSNGILFNYNGSKVIVINSCKYPTIWDIAENTTYQLETTNSPTPIQKVALSPDDKYIALGSLGMERPINLWSTKNKTLVRQLSTQACHTFGLAFTSDSKNIIISSMPDITAKKTDFTIQNIETGQTLYNLSDIQDGLVYYIASAPQHNLFASINNNTIYIWNSSLLSKPSIIEIDPSEGDILDLIFSPNKPIIAIKLEKTQQQNIPQNGIGIITDLGGYCTNSIMIYDIYTGKMIEHIKKDVAQAWFKMSFSRDGKKLLNFTKTKNGDTYYYTPTIWNLNQ